MRLIITLVLLIPSLSLGQTFLKCHEASTSNDEIYEPYIGHDYWLIEKDNESLKYILHDGSTFDFLFLEEDDVFVSFDNSVDGQRFVLITFNRYTLEMVHTSYNGDDTVVDNFQCEKIEKQF